MKRLISQIRYFSIVISLLTCAAIAARAADSVHFRVKVDASLVQKNQSFSGRLLIFMTDKTAPMQMISPNFADPNAVYITGIEISNLDADKIIEVNPDSLAFPRKFSDAPAGEYQVMALLDRDHSVTYDGPSSGDLYSDVVKITLPNETVELTLSKMLPERKIEVPENVKIVEFESPALSAFWGKPMKMQASVILPPDYDTAKNRKYPTMYVIHGYGGDHFSQLRGAAAITNAMKEGKIPEMIYVGLNAHTTLGHHVFADSANNGPWGTALGKRIYSVSRKAVSDGRKAFGQIFNRAFERRLVNALGDDYASRFFRRNLVNFARSG